MKIGIVNDLALAVTALRRALSLRPDHQVIWVAKDGQEAVDYCSVQKPDLILMDLVMPRLDGVEATRRIMAESPCAILIVTVDVHTHAQRVYEAMGAGAIDAIDTPILGHSDARKASRPLLDKIDQIGRMTSERDPVRRAMPEASSQPAGESATQLVAIGVSAGGPAALATLLSALPRDFPAAIVIVQHVDRAFAVGLAQWLDEQSALRVRIATEGERPQSGVALIAATNDHLTFLPDGRLGYTREPVQAPYRPSVDVFFQSLVQRWRGKAIGVLLTGMGRDGAAGLKAMRDHGHWTIAQDAATSAVYGMPKAAAALDAASAILPLGSIAHALAHALAEPGRHANSVTRGDKYE
ncbi:Protein-glutamate methylesterase/protein-glutamine glutaminase 4 [Pararobbsia alpina]|uniref:chemotaxis response regulator protein-glutamate methylesterase n=1 Tax=Pararobbsia alpina TaxID=621374 RepID=UPI0039A5FD01